MTKQIRRVRTAFRQAVTEYLKGHGAEPDGFYQFRINTRFDDTKTAKRFLEEDCRLNPYSGKWNFIFGDDAIATGDALECFVMELRRLLDR